MERDVKNKSILIPILVVLFYLIISVVIFFNSGVKDYISNYVEGGYEIGVITYIGLVVLGIVFAPISFLPLIPVAVLVFGPFQAALYNVIGWTIGAVISFWISRTFGKSVVSRFFSGKNLDKFEVYVPKKAHFLSLVVMRIVIPVDLLSYALGLFSGVSYFKYITSTIIGVIPFAIIFSYWSDFIFSSNNLSSVYISGAVLLFIFFVYVVIYRRKRHTQGMKTIVTHSGVFHADDVFSVATLLLIFPDAKIIRSRDPKVIEGGDIVLDVGAEYDSLRHRFDHHQVGGAGVRENKIPYAAFGLIWKNFGARLCSTKEVANKIEEKLVLPIDANDNGLEIYSNKFPGIHTYSIDKAIVSFRPTWTEERRDMDESFFEAVSFAKIIIKREIAREEAKVKAYSRVKKVYDSTEDKRLIILSEDISWGDVLSKFSEPLFVVSPKDGNWRVECVKDDTASFAQRKSLPAKWAGKRDEELVKVTGVQDAIFCHNARFVAVASSREGAVSLAKQALGKK